MTRYQSVRQQIQLLTPTEQLRLLQEIAALLLQEHSLPQPNTTPNFPLAGTVLHYDDPFSPAVSPDDWDAVS